MIIRSMHLEAYIISIALQLKYSMMGITKGVLPPYGFSLVRIAE